MIARVLGVLVLAAALAACGGDDGGGDDPGGGGTGGGTGGTGGVGGTGGGGGVEAPVCEDARPPCGGSPVGTWQYEAACGTASMIIGLSRTTPECDDIRADVEWNHIEGRITFREDGTSLQEQRGQYTVVFEVPGACFDALAPGVPHSQSCAGISNSLGSQEGTSGGCYMEGGVRCICDLATDSEDTQEVDWSAEGNVLTLQGNPHEYCVADGYLTWRFAQGRSDFGFVASAVP